MNRRDRQRGIYQAERERSEHDSSLNGADNRWVVRTERDIRVQREIIRPEGFARNPILVPAVRFGDLVYTAGMVGHDPSTGQMVGDDIRSQGRQTMANLQAALEAAGTSLDHALKVTAFVADLADRPAFNEVYLEFFNSEPPARTCIQGGFLGDGVLVEVEVVACVPS